MLYVTKDKPDTVIRLELTKNASMIIIPIPKKLIHSLHSLEDEFYVLTDEKFMYQMKINNLMAKSKQFDLNDVLDSSDLNSYLKIFIDSESQLFMFIKDQT